MRKKGLIIFIIFSQTFFYGCSSLKYAKEHPFKSLGKVTAASLVIAGNVAKAYSQNYQSQYQQPTYTVQSVQPVQPVKRIQLIQPVQSTALASANINTQYNYLGKLSSNTYDSDSITNPYGQYGSVYSSQSINNPYGIYGSIYSGLSVNNPYTLNAPKIYSKDGKYLGKLSSNLYDPESINNPYGIYGSPYSANSINNKMGIYGSPYSSESVNNPYATETPRIYGK